MRLRQFAFLLLFLFCVTTSAQESVRRSEIMSLVLIPHDLTTASRVLTIFDRDDNGAIDKTEIQRLAWKDDALGFDIDRNGELNHVELALRQAHLRSLDDIEEADIKLATAFLNQYDKNRNGKLDGDEIDKVDWPNAPEEFDSDANGEITFRELAAQFAFARGLRAEMGIVAVDDTRAGRTMNRFDSDHDKSLSAGESDKAPLPRPSSEFDENHDGMLSLLELATMYAVHRRKLGLTPFDVKKIDSIFARHDSDWDGRIEIGVVREQLAKQVGAGAKFMFNSGDTPANSLSRFDVNNDLVITISEVEKHLAANRKQLGYSQVEYQEARRLMTRYDANRTRYLDRNEINSAIEANQLPKNLLSTADRNKDGKIVHEELARHLFGSK